MSDASLWKWGFGDQADGIKLICKPIRGSDFSRQKFTTPFGRSCCPAIVPKGLVLSLIVVCTLLFTGWKGWEMVYRYRVGVADTIETREAARETHFERHMC